MTYSAIQLLEMEEAMWFCLKAEPKREHIAAAALRQVAGIKTLAPRIRFRKATARGPVWFAEALFPCYVFAKFRFAELHRRVRSMPGIVSIVHFGDRIATLDEQVIAEIATAATEEGVIVVDPGVNPGDQVRVAAGPLRGAEGEVTEVLPGKERVRLLLNFLGRDLPAEVALAELVPAILPRHF